jgi:hypothetical protein
MIERWWILLEKPIRWGNVGREAGSVILGDFVQDVLKAAKELEQNYECPLEVKKNTYTSTLRSTLELSAPHRRSYSCYAVSYRQ